MRQLSKKAQELIDGSYEEKMALVFSDKWIEYDRAKNALIDLQELVSLPRVVRPQNMMIVGHTNNGKSALLKKFIERNPYKLEENKDHYTVPCAYIQASGEGGIKFFYGSILDSVNFPHRPNGSAEVKRKQVIDTLRKLETKVLVIDEMNHLLSYKGNGQQVMLNAIKYLSNELRINIIGAGTEDALNVIKSDSQTANRFEPFYLYRWKYDREYLKILFAFEAMLPLKKESNLIEKQKAEYILMKSEGLLGEIVKIIRAAFKYCLRNKLDYISMTVLKSIDYEGPVDLKGYGNTSLYL